jgi:hypothetical protein
MRLPLQEVEVQLDLALVALCADSPWIVGVCLIQTFSVAHKIIIVVFAKPTDFKPPTQHNTIQSNPIQYNSICLQLSIGLLRSAYVRPSCEWKYKQFVCND